MTPSPRTVLAVWIILTACTHRCTSAPVPPVVQQGAVTQCSPQNKHPCETFPTLCTAGGGRCVSKDPCEYQCLCPDGRLGRDCTKSSSPDQGSVVDTLLIFPKDIFADANHVSKSEVFAKSNRHNATNTVESNTTDFSMSGTITLTRITTSFQESTTTAVTEVTKNNSPPSSSISNPPFPSTSKTLNTNPLGESSVTTAVPSLTETTTTSSISKSTTKNNMYPASGNNSREQDRNSSNFTGKPTDTSSRTELSTVTTFSTQRVNTNTEASTGPPYGASGSSSKTEPNGGSPQAAESLRADVFNPNEALTIRRSFKPNLILSHGIPTQSASTTTQNPQQKTTQQHHATTTPQTTNSGFSSTQDTGTWSQQTSTTTTASSTEQSTATAEDFPTLFKLTVDSQSNPIDSGTNSALSMVVHRVFLPIEAFQPALRAAP
ncbi:unnamed protein product [Candidula unifasciata]|uniref:EGF-like domain-containing protein n=1 Tax=Candidula unifasciata TaxID=100452 RepID=A0A8S3YM55_9EUPU|nr:unnamed protein product [Candidula unifasciata]